MPTTSTAVTEHPAVVAWQRLGPGHRAPRALHCLQRSAKSGVYRLDGAGPRGEPVIAKRGAAAEGAVEREIYLAILPRLSLPSPRCFGALDDPDAAEVWLFLEDLGLESADPVLETHRVLAAEWLAVLHTRAAAGEQARHLPDRGPSHFRGRLEAARAIATERLATAPKPSRADRVTAVLATCDEVVTRWPDIEAACSKLPSTLVHGDFVDENLRVRVGPAGPALVPLDWEKAGWGAPAVDLAKIDVDAYASAVRTAWPRVTRDAVTRAALCGSIFRPLVHNWSRKPLGELASYASRMSSALEALSRGGASRDAEPDA